MKIFGAIQCTFFPFHSISLGSLHFTVIWIFSQRIGKLSAVAQVSFPMHAPNVKVLVALPWSFWYFNSSHSVPEALGSLAISNLSGRWMASCCWGWWSHSPRWSKFESYRSSNVVALPEWPWHACSSPSVPGVVGSFIHSALTLAVTLTLAQPWLQWQLGTVAEILLAIGGTA